MRLLALIAATLVACHSTSAPTDQSVYGALVEAGCLAPSDGGVAAVAAERATGHDAWLSCLYDGGTIQSCAVPCTKATP